MTSAEIQSATDQLIAETKATAVGVGAQAESRATQLAPGLATGSNAEGGYNYGRFIAPVVDPLTTSLTLTAKQDILKQAIRDQVNGANDAYTDAQFGYRQRQREFEANQARRARAARAAADAQIAAQAKQIAQLQQQGALVVKPYPAQGGTNYNPQGNNYNPQPLTYNPQNNQFNPQQPAGIQLQGPNAQGGVISGVAVAPRRGNVSVGQSAPTQRVVVR